MRLAQVKALNDRAWELIPLDPTPTQREGGYILAAQELGLCPDAVLRLITDVNDPFLLQEKLLDAHEEASC